MNWGAQRDTETGNTWSTHSQGCTPLANHVQQEKSNKIQHDCGNKLGLIIPPPFLLASSTNNCGKKTLIHKMDLFHSLVIFKELNLFLSSVFSFISFITFFFFLPSFFFFFMFGHFCYFNSINLLWHISRILSLSFVPSFSYFFSLLFKLYFFHSPILHLPYLATEPFLDQINIPQLHH